MPSHQWAVWKTKFDNYINELNIATTMETKRAIIYARSASDSQEERGPLSVSTQLEVCASKAAKKGYKVIAEIGEYPASGHTKGGEGLQLLREIVRQDCVDAVIVTEASRLSRDIELFSELSMEFAEEGTQILFAR